MHRQEAAGLCTGWANVIGGSRLRRLGTLLVHSQQTPPFCSLRPTPLTASLRLLPASFYCYFVSLSFSCLYLAPFLAGTVRAYYGCNALGTTVRGIQKQLV